MMILNYSQSRVRQSFAIASSSALRYRLALAFVYTNVTIHQQIPNPIEANMRDLSLMIKKFRVLAHAPLPIMPFSIIPYTASRIAFFANMKQTPPERKVLSEPFDAF